MLSVGTKVKNFALPDAHGNLHQLDDYTDQTVVIYFYPKDNTKGCTTQACAFRDLHQVYEEKNIKVIGISKDSPKSHQSFIDNHNLDFLLLSDESLDVIKMFDVWIEKSMYGKKYMGVARATFIIQQGIITHVFEKASPKENASDILKALK